MLATALCKEASAASEYERDCEWVNVQVGVQSVEQIAAAVFLCQHEKD